MNSHVNIAPQPAGQQLFDSGFSFTAMGKRVTRVTPLGAVAAGRGCSGGDADAAGDGVSGPPAYRRLADGDGH